MGLTPSPSWPGMARYSSSQTFTWNVNSPISLTVPADQTNNEGDTVSLSLSATDSISGATLRYAAQGLPTGLVISPTSGAITGTIAPGASANGPYSVTIEAEDGTYTNTQTFTWNVNSPVSLTAARGPNQQRGRHRVPGDFGYGRDQRRDPELHRDRPAQRPDASIPAPARSPARSATAAPGNPPSRPAMAPTATRRRFNWTVNSPITITDPGDQVNNPGDTVSLQVSATDTASGTLSYAATGLPTGLSINSSTGLISGTITASTGFVHNHGYRQRRHQQRRGHVQLDRRA